MQGLKLSGENLELNLHHIQIGNSFLDITSNTQMTKEQIDKLDFLKI